MAKEPKDMFKAVRGKGLEACVKVIRKEYGKDALVYKDWTDTSLDVIPTGIPSIDIATGIGGIPRGRVTTVFGMESSGKTTLCTHLIASAQSMGLRAAMIDSEQAFDIDYAETIGIDKEDLIFGQPKSGDEALEIASMLIESGEIGVLIIDSVANLTPQKELETGKPEMGGIARLMSAALRRLTSQCREHNTALVFINQIRMKIGVVFGNPETMPGGNALKFHSSMILRIAKTGAIIGEDGYIGNHTKIKFTKNKCAPPAKEATFDIIYGEGIDKYGSLLDLAVDMELITKSSSYYTIGDQKINGKRNAVEIFKEYPDISSEIYNKVMIAKLPRVYGAAKAVVEVVEEVETTDAGTDE